METWGSLPKSQEDNSTIDQEIDSKIVVHNNDPDAHLEAGQSLQSHKASQIIDHIARSVVRDKLAFDRFTIDSHFESIDSWIKSGNCYLAGLNAFVIQTAASLNSEAYAIISEVDNQQNQGDYSKNPDFQVTIYLEDVDDQLVYVGPITDSLDTGFGFKIVNDALYAVYFDDDNSEVAYSLLTVDYGTNYVLRCMFDPDTNTHHWYINGTEVYSAVYSHSYALSVYAFFYIKTTDRRLKRLWLSNFHYDAIMSYV